MTPAGLVRNTQKSASRPVRLECTMIPQAQAERSSRPILVFHETGINPSRKGETRQTGTQNGAADATTGSHEARGSGRECHSTNLIVFVYIHPNLPYRAPEFKKGRILTRIGTLSTSPGMPPTGKTPVPRIILGHADARIAPREKVNSLTTDHTKRRAKTNEVSTPTPSYMFTA